MIKVGLVGYGSMGRIHARILSKLDLLGAIVEPGDGNAEQAMLDFDVPVYSSLSDLEVELDAFVIAVPTPFHASVMEEVVTRFPEAKAMILEKPISPTLAEARDLVSKLGDYSERIIVGHVEIYNPVVQRFLSIMHSGDYGRLRSFMIFRKGSVPRDRLSSLSDILVDIGVHDFDIVTRLISGEVRLYTTGLYQEGNLNSAIISFMGDDFHGVVQLSREFSGKEREIIVECERASIKVDLIAQTIEIRELRTPEGDGASISIPHGPGSSLKLYGEPLLVEILNLRDIVTKGVSPVVGLEDGLKTLMVVEKCRESLENRSPVTLTI